jgi:PEP-CTERM motif
LALDPESKAVEVLFTAPKTATYTITGEFEGIDNGSNSGGFIPTHPVNVLDDGSSIFFSSISAYQQVEMFTLKETVSAGGTIGFTVGTGTNGSCSYCNLSTGLSASITTAPEPSTWAMLLAGFVGLGFAGSRASRRAAAAAQASEPL